MIVKCIIVYVCSCVCVCVRMCTVMTCACRCVNVMFYGGCELNIRRSLSEAGKEKKMFEKKMYENSELSYTCDNTTGLDIREDKWMVSFSDIL